jgi:hypothetical protein
MATCDYSADSAPMPPSLPVFVSRPDPIGTCVFVFERGLVPACATFPLVSITA